MTEKELIQKIYKEKRFDYGFIKEKVELYYFIKNEWEPFKEKLNKEVI
jgi:hypothetical protein